MRTDEWNSTATETGLPREWVSIDDVGNEDGVEMGEVDVGLEMAEAMAAMLEGRSCYKPARTFR